MAAHKQKQRVKLHLIDSPMSVAREQWGTVGLNSIFILYSSFPIGSILIKSSSITWSSSNVCGNSGSWNKKQTELSQQKNITIDKHIQLNN